MVQQLLLQAVGQTAADRAVVTAAWVGIIAIAAIILVASAMTSRGLRR
jgi:hypothetical protein